MLLQQQRETNFKLDHVQNKKGMSENQRNKDADMNCIF